MFSARKPSSASVGSLFAGGLAPEKKIEYYALFQNALCLSRGNNYCYFAQYKPFRWKHLFFCVFIFHFRVSYLDI